MDPQSHEGHESDDGVHDTEPPHAGVHADGTLAVAAPDLTGLHPNAVTVAQALAGLGVAGTVRELAEAAPTAATAAAQLGVTVGAIANSLVFDADGQPLLVLTSGAHRADTLALAGLVGASQVKRATPEFVRQHTGQPIGGVAPVGHPHPLRTVVDVELLAARRRLGGRRPPALRLPHQLRRAAAHHRRRGRRGGRGQGLTRATRRRTPPRGSRRPACSSRASPPSRAGSPRGRRRRAARTGG